MDHPLNSSDLNIPKLLKQVGHHPNKRLGQNFLIDPRYLKRVADAGEIIDQDQVLEIGAGVGNLTVLLARKAKQVIAVEIDSSLIPILNQVVKTYPNITIVQGDILELDLLELVGATSYHVVANIPYYITSKLIRKLMTSSAYPQNVILTIQNEVADRICARTGKLSLLGLSVQIFGHP
ncbi:MAG: rRNA adenine dimethyltransferase family protein, partial [Anaerolineales bacterium]